MKICTKCGIDLLSEDVYCPNCGTKVPVEVKPEPTTIQSEPTPSPVDNKGTGFFDQKLKNGLRKASWIGVMVMAFASVFVAIGCVRFPPIGALIVIAFIGYVFGLIWNLITFFKVRNKEEKPLNKWLPLIVAGICLLLGVMCLFL